MKDHTQRRMSPHAFWLVVWIVATLFSPCYSEAYNQEIQDISGVMAVKISQAGKGTVAVVDFTDLKGDVTELGRFIAERFSVALAGSGQRFTVIDRTHIKTILKEHKLSSTGLIDTQTAKELGKIAGVDALITGTLTPFGDTVEMTIKVLDTETAKVIDAGIGSLPKTQAIKELLEKNISTSGTTSSSSGAGSSAQQIVESEGFIFNLKGCKRSGGSVRCEFLITSIDKDRKLGIGESSSLFDNLGNEYGADEDQLEISKRLRTFVNVSSGSKFRGDYREGQFFANVPMKAALTFKGVASDAKTIALLAANFAADDYFTVEFRNVSFSK